MTSQPPHQPPSKEYQRGPFESFKARIPQSLQNQQSHQFELLMKELSQLKQNKKLHKLKNSPGFLRSQNVTMLQFSPKNQLKKADHNSTNFYQKSFKTTVEEIEELPVPKGRKRLAEIHHNIKPRHSAHNQNLLIHEYIKYPSIQHQKNKVSSNILHLPSNKYQNNLHFSPHFYDSQPRTQQYRSAHYYHQWCYSDVDCDILGGEVCWVEYEGCERGRCVCNEVTHQFVHNLCVPS